MKRTMQVIAVLGWVLSACSNGNRVDNNPNDPNAIKGLHIEIVGSDRAVLAPLRSMPVTVRLLLGTQPVAGAQIEVTIQGAAQGSRISRASVVTNAVGESEDLTFTAGASTANVTLVFSAPNAESARLNISISGKHAGNLVVRPIASGLPSDLKVAFLNVRLHDGRGVTCSSLVLDDAPNGLPAVAHSANVPGLNMDARFNGLTEKTKYIATVVAVNAVGRAVAVGCGGPEEVTAQRDKTIQVPLKLADPSIIGKYEYAMDLEPLQFMEKKAPYAWISNILHLLQDPGRTILTDWIVYNESLGIIENKGLCVGSNGAVGVVCTAGAAAFNPVLDAVLSLDDSGSALLVRYGLTDAASMLLRLHIGGTLDVKTHNRTTGDITAALGFDTYNLIWRAQPKCNPEKNPTQCCGHYVFDAGSLTSSPNETVQTQTTGVFQPFIRACGNGPTSSFSSPCPDLPGRVTKVEGTLPGDVSYNLSLPPSDLPAEHALAGGAVLSLAYGSLVLGIVEGVVLPNVLSTQKFPGTTINGTRIVKLGDMLRGLLNCATIADASSRALCDGASSATDALFGQFIGALSFNGTSDWFAKMKVNGRFLDTDRDRIVETMQGTVDITAATGSPSDTTTARSTSVDALYTGANCTGDVACAAGMACRFAKNPLDNCYSKTYCGVPAGVKKGGDPCFQDSECYSGLCIKAVAGYSVTNTNRCYQACKADSDCGLNATCDIDGLVMVEGNGLSASPTDVVTRAGTCVPKTITMIPPTL